MKYNYLYTAFISLLSIGAASAQGNTPCTAATITPAASCSFTAGTTAGASFNNDGFPATSCGSSGSPDVWYTFTPATSGSYTISTQAGTITDGVMQLYSATDCTGTSSSTIACSDDAVGTMPQITASLTAGTVYYIRFWRYGASGTGTFGICVVAPPAAPANDNCPTATTLTHFPNGTCTTTNATVAGATQSQAGCTGTANDDVWFSFVATATSADIQVSWLEDEVVQVFSGACSGNGGTGSLICQDSPEGSVLVTGLTVGQTYRFRVYDYYTTVSATPTFTVCVTTPPAPPANDNCPTATVLTHFPYGTCTTTNATVTNATQSQAGCTGTANDDVWFSFVATSTSADIQVSWLEDEVVQVFSGACSGNGGTGSLICQDSPEGSVLVTGLTVGQTYRFRVYDYYSSTSTTPTFTVCVTSPPPPPANDNCPTAISLTHNATCEPTAAYLTGATQSAAGCAGTANDDVWFSFVATNDTAIVSRIGNFDSVMEIFSGNCSGNTASSSLICQDAEGSVTLTGLTIGQTYRIRVYSWSSTTPLDNNFNICVSSPEPAPDNVTCAEMEPICTANNLAFTAAATGTAEPGNLYGCLIDQPDPTWYYFEIATDGDIDMLLQAPQDVDFAIWGPYANLAAAQAACGTLPAPIDCSFDPDNTEYPSITGAVVGEVYVMVITNFANVVQPVTLQQTGGLGSTNCTIVTNPPCEAEAGGW